MRKGKRFLPLEDKQGMHQTFLKRASNKGWCSDCMCSCRNPSLILYGLKVEPGQQAVHHIGPVQVTDIVCPEHATLILVFL